MLYKGESLLAALETLDDGIACGRGLKTFCNEVVSGVVSSLYSNFVETCIVIGVMPSPIWIESLGRFLSGGIILSDGFWEFYPRVISSYINSAIPLSSPGR